MIKEDPLVEIQPQTILLFCAADCVSNYRKWCTRISRDFGAQKLNN
jgi:hypothetical protein